jgi:CBS-domain-containing membrane protein
MRVGDVMTRRVRTVRQEESTDLATAVLRLQGYRHLPVLDPGDHVVGMLTPTDLLETARATGRTRPIAISEVMRRPVETIRAEDDLDVAIAQMRQAGVHALPVVDEADHLEGIVTDVDALIALARARSGFTLLERVVVDAVMTHDPVSVGPETCLAEAAEALLQGGFRHLPVIDDAGRLVGILSERDLRTRLGLEVEGFCAATLEALTAPVSEAMTPDPISARVGAPLSEVLEAFTTERLGSLPVIDDADRLVGILSYVDVLRWLRRSAVADLSAR